MSSRRFTAEDVLSQLINWDSDVEEEISEMEDSSEPEDNAIDDPDCQFSHDDEDSEDESTSVPSTDENQETQQSSSTEGIWTSKDDKIKWSTSPHQSRGRLLSSNVIKMTPGPTRFAVTRVDDIESAFQLFISPAIENIILDMTNLEGRRSSVAERYNGIQYTAGSQQNNTVGQASPS
ncbi:hypothetical protein SRHO_G00246840 [Serrasalmus rhombeus]